ncbi:peptidylprolyl isomerase [Ramlibacter sp. AW1]|uniref:Chaperone SurA n=1 Tax=Ramlibacter aurantiacus TaxID=2801330 RepID=A0A936ZPU9_9BURK|nr:peptidylprolyl isomerase [Ramlibacter aurantiacus]MBL0421248.1 peptidylprolyl isomerase [Ramlibacter aurantiacus]
MISIQFPRPRAIALGLVAGAFLASTTIPASAQLRLGPGPGVRSAPVPSTAAPAASDPSTRSADYIVAVVNSEPITNNEVQARVARVQQELSEPGARMPDRESLVRQVLEQLIVERAQLQLARELQLRVDEGMVDAAEQNIARQNQLDVADFRRRLAAEGISPESFRQDLRNQLLLSRLRQREVEPRVRVTDAEVERFIHEQQNTSDLSAVELNLAHILVAVPENAPAELVRELRTKAERVRDRARAGEDFAALARELSDAPGAATNGGVVGVRTADRYPSLFVEATQPLAPGQVSDVVRSGAGFHVIKVLEKRRGELPGSTVVQNRARHILLRPTAQLSESEARQRLEDFKKRIESGQAEFAELARRHSQDGSAREGGDLGWANPGMFVPEFEEVLATLSPGQIADPVQTRFGLHLIQLVDRRQHTLSPREQRELARNVLREKRLQEEYARWARDVRARAWVELRDPPR